MSNANHIDVHTLAKFFNRDVRTMQLWVNDGMPREDRGLYDFVKCVRWRLDKLEAENDILKTSGDEKRYKVQMEGDKIKNKLIETKWRREIGHLVDKKAVLIAWGNQNNIVGTKSEFLKEDLKREINTLIPKALHKNVSKIIDQNINSMKELISKLELEKYIIDEEKIIEDADPLADIQ